MSVTGLLATEETGKKKQAKLQAEFRYAIILQGCVNSQKLCEGTCTVSRLDYCADECRMHPVENDESTTDASMLPQSVVRLFK